MNAELAANPATESSDDDDYARPWWGGPLLHRLILEKKKRQTVIADCRRMLRYALDEGRPFPATLTEAIAQIDFVLIKAGRRPLSEVPREIIQPSEEVPSTATTPTPKSTASVNQVILEAHNALSNLVAPATAQSLRATDPAIVLFGLPPIAKFAIIGAIVCTLYFLAAVAKPISGVLTHTDKIAQASPAPKITANVTPTPPASPSPGRALVTPTPSAASPTPNP